MWKYDIRYDLNLFHVSYLSPFRRTAAPGNAVWVGAKLPRNDFLAARPLVAAEPEAFLGGAMGI